MSVKKVNNSEFRLDDIPKDKCKLFEIEGQKVAVCHDTDDKFRFYKLEPIRKKRVSS